MAKKDCINCKNCTLKKSAYENGYTTVCDFQDKIKSLSDDELLERIITKKCDWFAKGTPKTSNKQHFDD